MTTKTVCSLYAFFVFSALGTSMAAYAQLNLEKIPPQNLTLVEKREQYKFDDFHEVAEIAFVDGAVSCFTRV